MSNVYTLEPNTSGRVVLNTSHGSIVVGLWLNENPNAARRFLQAAVDEKYTNCVFDRVVPGALVQLGSAEDAGNVENHGRLKFRRRGLIAMVGSGNAFFITLAATPWLDGKHTIIGEVQDKTIFNVLTLADTAQNAGDDSKPRVLNVIVEENPCADIIPTQVSRPVPRSEKSKSNTVAVRDLRLLSFANPDDEDHEDTGVRNVPQRGKKAMFPSAIPQSASELETQTHLKSDEASGKSMKKPRGNSGAVVAEVQIANLLSKVRKKRAPKKATPEVRNSTASASDINPQQRRATQEKGKLNLGTAGRRKRGSAREAEVLRKLARFEKKLTASRSKMGKDGNDAWYAEPLKLQASFEMAEDEDDYEVLEGGAHKAE